MTKRIIIRIIVAVSVAFILSKFKLLGIMNVSALEYATLQPYQTSVFKKDMTSLGNSTQVITFQGARHYYYGNNFTVAQGTYVGAITFQYSFGSSSPFYDKVSNVQFAFFMQGLANHFNKPFNVYLRDYENNISYCQVNSSIDTIPNEAISNQNLASVYNTASCSNAVLYGGSFQVVLLVQDDSSQYSKNLTFGISPLTINFNDTNKQILEESQKQTQAQQETNNKIQETNDYLKSDDHSDADSEASGFFNNFGGNNHGISGIVTAPLRLLQSLSTASCSPLTFSLPFINEQVTLPCMRGIYEQYFGVFFSLWQLITTGLISYNVSLNIYSKVRAMQNPNNDKIEVLNL